ncbi:MAG TPA: carboxypeptidase-like regulatory domain-containing protein, partial [Terracidiphilus sp.]
MRLNKITSALFCSLLLGATAYAASVSGTVTNKTTDKPSPGDKVELVDVQASMSAVATATTNGSGKYTLNEPGAGPYLIRATHQGAGYFIAAPQGAGSGDISVYDASPNVPGVSVEDQIIDLEAPTPQQLDVTEQFVVHNASSPRMTKSGNNTFEFSLPDGAVIDMAEATRPSGLPTMAQPSPFGGKNHYAFNTPIEPDQGLDKMTVFQLHYHLPYSGKYTFKPTVSIATSHLAVQLPKSMTFAAGSGASYQSIQPQQQDPSVQTFLLQNAQPGRAMEFTVSGTGAMPREQQQGGGQDSGQAAPAGGTPGGGIG